MILSPLAKGITQINGRRANQAYAVHTGDIISFGRVETRVFIRRNWSKPYDEIEQTKYQNDSAVTTGIYSVGFWAADDSKW